MDKLKCGIFGATGVAGQQFVEALAQHPWFAIEQLYASEHSAGKKYRDAAAWHSPEPLDERIGDIVVRNVADFERDLRGIDVFFSALPSETAQKTEGDAAKHKPVISTAAAYRYDADVPLLIPEVNPEHAALIAQQKKRGWSGFVAPGPNCTTIGLTVALKPLYDAAGLRRVVMTSMQAISGAGYPGVASYDILDNVVPYIAKEEEKVRQEVVKILGSASASGIRNAAFALDCICTRAAVIDGHTEAVFAETERECTPQDYKRAIGGFNKKAAQVLKGLPSAPEKSIIVKEEPNRPQPRLDRMLGDGMSTVIGRIRECGAFEGLQFVVLSHNTRKGAAKGGVLTAEFLHKKGIL